MFIDTLKGSRSIDHYFHYRLAELSHNAMFMNFIDSYYDVIDEVVAHTTKNASRRKEIYKEHLEIIQALKERDKEKAKAAVVSHLKIVLQNIKMVK